MMEGCLRSFLLLVPFLGFLSPGFVLGRRLGGLTCWLCLAWGATCPLLHWFVSARRRQTGKCWDHEAMVTLNKTAAKRQSTRQWRCTMRICYCHKQRWVCHSLHFKSNALIYFYTPCGNLIDTTCYIMLILNNSWDAFQVYSITRNLTNGQM